MWPSPTVPAKLPDLEYLAGWFSPKNQITIEGTDYAVQCLIEPDKATLSGWVKGHIERETVLEGEARKAAETIQTINATRR